jgi:two-component system, LytTR family, response regulator
MSGGLIKTLIVDDEPIARRVLREELEDFPDISVVGEAQNGREALRLITELQPNLVVLDLQMPVMGGFEVIRNLKRPPLPAIVIVTAFDQHAIEAFESGAIDYLLKPVSGPRLKKAVERVKGMLGDSREVAESVAQLAEFGERLAQPRARKIVGRSGQEYFLLDADEVLAFQAEGEIVWIVTMKHRIMATQPLRMIEERLRDLPFQRIHRNAIVNVNHVRKMSAMSSQRWLLTMSNAQEFIVSKRMAHTVRHMLQW